MRVRHGGWTGASLESSAGWRYSPGGDALRHQTHRNEQGPGPGRDSRRGNRGRCIYPKSFCRGTGRDLSSPPGRAPGRALPADQFRQRQCGYWRNRFCCRTRVLSGGRGLCRGCARGCAAVFHRRHCRSAAAGTNRQRRAGIATASRCRGLAGRCRGYHDNRYPAQGCQPPGSGRG